MIIFFACNLKAEDTTNVRVHNAVDMTWYGNYDQWGVFPDGSKTYRKIYLHYTMGCASTGCSDWDYTTKIEVRHRTGDIDSILQTSPTFTVNGSIQDSVIWNIDSTYRYFWDSVLNVVDSTLSTYYQIVQFNDPNNPQNPTDTLYGFEAGFYNMIYDNSGLILDSVFVSGNLEILAFYQWYSYFDIIETFELARVITPYGSYLSNDWKFTHIFDITDFAILLQDSVEIRAHYSGWSSGFSATLDFEFIEGTPPRNVNSLQNIYRGGCSYTNSSAFESSCLPAKKFFVDQNSTNGLIKMTTTGHGFDNNQYAAEFKEIDYFVKINGALTHIQNNWDDKCGSNPIYPQGGTWILDRANWCPGTRAQTFHHEITDYITPLDSVEINIDFDNYSWSGPQTPSYIIDCQLFLYGDPNFTNDAEIIDIIKPSIKDEYSRMNPICGKPLIKIRNSGTLPLTSVDIQYSVRGGVVHNYTWSGNLLFLQEEEVELPALYNWTGDTDVFEVVLSNPSGQADDYLANNSMISAFDQVPVYQNIFAVWTQTNSQPETSWNFYSMDGSDYFSSNPFMQTNTQHRDTIEFDNGCYTFLAIDSDEDGLEYWNNNDGAGYIKFRNVPGTTFLDFEPDFGSEIRHDFIAGSYVPLSIHDLNRIECEVYPNPSLGEIYIKGNFQKETNIICFNILGRKMFSKTLKKSSIQEHFNLDSFDDGIYFIKVENTQGVSIHKILKQ